MFSLLINKSPPPPFLLDLQSRPAGSRRSAPTLSRYARLAVLYINLSARWS